MLRYKRIYWQTTKWYAAETRPPLSVAYWILTLAPILFQDPNYDHTQQLTQQQAQMSQTAMGFNPAAARSLYAVIDIPFADGLIPVLKFCMFIPSSYIGGLDARVTEPLLYEIFAAMGHVEQVKLVKDRVVR
jgi:hypothetical protein